MTPLIFKFILISKAAVDHLVRTSALEVAKEGVRVNAVNPGVIVTDIHKRGGMADEKGLRAPNWPKG